MNTLTFWSLMIVLGAFFVILAIWGIDEGLHRKIDRSKADPSSPGQKTNDVAHA
jgi:hypothetical protein